MASRVRAYTTSDAYKSGVREGLRSVLRGGTFRTAPVRIHKSVGSPVADRAARYSDVAKISRDIARAQRVVFRD